MRQSLVAVVAAMLVFAAPRARADNAPLAEAVAEKVLGNPDAPVTLTEFASLTCPHCANFHHNFMPEIEKELIKTGHVKLVFVDFPLDGLAVAASMLARCSGDDRYFGFLRVLFRSQESWSRAPNPRAALMQVARLGGISESDFNACIANAELLSGIEKAAVKAQEDHGVESTPSFLINGEKIEPRQLGDVIVALRKAVAGAR